MSGDLHECVCVGVEAPTGEGRTQHLSLLLCSGLSDSFMKRGFKNKQILPVSVCVCSRASLSLMQILCSFCSRRFLNRSSEDDSASESCLPSEGTTSDPVTLRRRMLAAAAERRLQKQQTS